MQHAASESELGQVYPRVCGVDGDLELMINDD